MFWNTEYTPSPHIDNLLSKEDVRIEELLDDDEILQEYKWQNKRLVQYFHRVEIIEQLIDFITKEPPTDVADAVRFKYSNIACELLTTNKSALSTLLIEHQNLLERLYAFLEQQPPLNPLLASFFSKTFGMLISKNAEQDWFSYQYVCLQVLEFIKTRDGFLQTIFNHFGTPAIMDLLFHIITNVEGVDLKNNLFGWLKQQNLIPRMIDLLGVDEDPEKHNNICEFICEIISNSRTFRRNEIEEHGKIRPVEDISLALLQVLEDEVTTKSLLDIIISNTQRESCVVAGIRIVMKLLELENSPKAIQPIENVLKVEKEYHDIYLSSMLPIIAERIEEFHNLLINPPQKSDIRNTVELLSPPFGNTRLQICVMFAALLKEDNSIFTQAICNSEFFNTLLKLFKQYCWNNLLHTQVLNCVCAVFPILSPYETITEDLPVSALQSHVVVNCKLVSKLIDCWMHNKNEEASTDRKGRRLGYMGHLIVMLNNIVEISRNSTELDALLNSSMDAQEKTDYELALKEMDIQLVSQRRYLADIDPYNDPYQNLKDDHYSDYTNFDEPINDSKRDEIQIQFSDSWIGESSSNHGSSGDYQDDPKIGSDAWDWLSGNGQKSSSNVNTNFDDFFADFESHFSNPLGENDTNELNKFPLNDFNAKSDDFGPFSTFGVSDSNANLWTHIEKQFSNSSFEDAVFDFQSSNTESQAINNSAVPVNKNVESELCDEEISSNQPTDRQCKCVADLTTTLLNLSTNDISGSPQDHENA
ncbi:Serine/threonine-protein phosphatase 6 regulatory subunit 3-B [Pseudolycoriella hygida]|uniref:Serine/threonine-protein phosphatase 6 regulatory subunit 3-B n=1 Tax=Pseudolycoriella hygida TaxID=35572 RepID=A0A9Q0MN51_9DIPT|nr:Serine/threonine-protein phosphatase 6 regulatory subunit 3-B [Pseudolycoriella hygida]